MEQQEYLRRIVLEFVYGLRTGDQRAQRAGDRILRKMRRVRSLGPVEGNRSAVNRVHRRHERELVAKHRKEL